MVTPSFLMRQFSGIALTEDGFPCWAHVPRLPDDGIGWGMAPRLG